MISIIICTVNPVHLANLKKNIATTTINEYEVIAIDNKENTYSISSAYNYGASIAKFQYLCFIHEDILFHTHGWDERLVNHLYDGRAAVAGILGCLIKTKCPSGVYNDIQHLNRINQLQRSHDRTATLHYLNNPLNEISSEVATLDGMLLASAQSNHIKYPFDETMLTGFHGYDIDYSLGQAANGKVIVVYDILIEHFSHGGNTIKWIDAQLNITRKWKAKLPRAVNINVRETLAAEIANTEIFLRSLFANSYKKHVQLKYLLKLLRLRPISFKNLFYIRKFLIHNRLESWIKKRIS